MGQRFTVERDMKPEDRESFDAFIRERLPTVDEATEWSEAHGYTIHRSCIAGYMKALKLRICAEASATMVSAACGDDPSAIAKANRLMLHQRVFEALQAGEEEGEFSLSDIKDGAAAVKSLAQTEAIEAAVREAERKRLAEIAAEEMKKLQDTAKAKGKITDADLEEAAKKIFG